MADTIEDLQEELKITKAQLAESEKRRSVYENGGAKLYYSLQRKMSEMANALNKYSLEDLDMVSKSDATFERVFKLLEKSEVISSSATGLGTIAGITGDESKDVSKKPFVDTIAESRR